MRSIEKTDDGLTISAVSTQRTACCPLCSSAATRVHSHYTRHVADLPCAGQQVRLLLQVRKFFCEVTTCARKIFVERMVAFVEPWARVTTRLYQSVQAIGLATGGMLGAGLTDRLGIQTCPITILRQDPSIICQANRGNLILVLKLPSSVCEQSTNGGEDRVPLGDS